VQTRLGRFRRIVITTIVVSTLICVCGGLITAWGNDNEVADWPIAVGGIAALLLLGWGVVGIIRSFQRSWRLFRHGELIWATVEWKRPVSDGDGGHTWDVQVSGRTRDGQIFRRMLRAGYTEPPAVGGTMEVRHDAATGATELVERGPGAVAIFVVVELVLVLLLGGLLYTIGAIIWAYARALT